MLVPFGKRRAQAVALPFGFGHRFERGLFAVVLQIFEHEQRVVALLLRLHGVPVSKPVKTLLGIVIGKIQIQIRRVKFLVDLLVDKRGNFLVHDR